jgi:tRNA(fMet)-specific endonuclease VapC
MFVLDTDTLSHLLRGHAKVAERHRQATRDVVITAATRIEMLRGRFDSVMKAEDGEKLVLAQERLVDTERDLEAFDVLPIDAAAGAEFDRLRKERKLKKLGRGDLLIAAIVLANKATLVTRNTKDFSQVPGLQLENWVD